MSFRGRSCHLISLDIHDSSSFHYFRFGHSSQTQTFLLPATRELANSILLNAARWYVTWHGSILCAYRGLRSRDYGVNARRIMLLAGHILTFNLCDDEDIRNIANDMCCKANYHMAGNFCGVLIFVIFVVELAVTKFGQIENYVKWKKIP